MKAKTIRDSQINNLIISEDTDENANPIAVLLYTPNMSDTQNHFHIELDMNKAAEMHAWLGDFLKRT